MSDLLTPTVCRYEHFLTDWYARWATVIGSQVPKDEWSTVALHRKTWEFAAILEILSQRGLLAYGKKGLGFAVGHEPLPAAMALHGVEVLATDLMVDQVNDSWKWNETGQHATGLEGLRRDWISDSDFDERVSFQPADMTDLATLSGEFDFLWSSCAFEHLGSLEKGLDFVVNAMRLLKRGGIAVHTTEFNVSSNTETIAKGPDVIYRRRDIEELDYRLRKQGSGLEAINYDPGTHRHDLVFDVHPYYAPGTAHIKLELEGFVCTSLLIVAVKG